MQKSSYYIVNSISDGIFHRCKRFQRNSLYHLGRGTKDYGNSWGDHGGEGKDNFNWDHFAEGLFFWRAMFFSRNFNHDNVARLCIIEVANKKSLSFLPQMWIGHLLTCLLTEPKEGLWPALYEWWKRVRGRNRGTTEQQACKTVCQFIIKMGPRARLLSTTCFGPGNYRSARRKTLCVPSAFNSF